MFGENRLNSVHVPPKVDQGRIVIVGTLPCIAYHLVGLAVVPLPTYHLAVDVQSNLKLAAR